MPENEGIPQTRRDQMMLSDSLTKTITKLAFPSIIGFLITSICNLADTFFVSRLGESATAAVSVNAPLDQIIMMTGSMLAASALCIRLQCLALPAHGWVMIVNMLCAGLGKAKGALLLSTSRQGTCLLMSWPWGANGVAAVQVAADMLTLFLALPLIRRVMRQIQAAENQTIMGGQP